MVHAHSQKDEVNFIRSIASDKNGVVGQRTISERQAALNGYIAACEKRADWPNLDKHECIHEAKKALRGL